MRNCGLCMVYRQKDGATLLVNNNNNNNNNNNKLKTYIAHAS